ncbi:hypothetical protein [Paeniclostridium hominis]|uniref:hypothetical protein n=1 Tax=Paeniclostridium hominis TaxID=2764329 RepID=UPI0022E4E26F|nr:hypothetical protein [Paeniclostridium hominis]
MSKNNKKYDYKFEIEEYTEADLFEDGLDKNQKEKIKKRMSMLLEELKEANSKFNINVSLSEVLKIKKYLGESGDISEHGIKNSNVLKYIILKVIDKDMESLKNEIVDELFVPSFISMPGVNTSYINHGASYFFKLYLTKDKLIYYGITENFKIVNKKIIDVKEVKSIGKAIENRRWSKGLAWGVNTTSGYMSFIETNDKNIIYLNHLKNKYRKSVIRFLSSLERITGIKAVKKSPLTYEDKFVLGLEIVALILVLTLVVPRLIELCINMSLIR